MLGFATILVTVLLPLELTPTFSVRVIFSQDAILSNKNGFTVFKKNLLSFYFYNFKGC